MKPLSFAKVDENAETGVCDSHIVEQLSPVFTKQLRDSFQFYDDILKTNEIGFIGFLQLDTMIIHL